jgi:hypothetical protein
VDILRFGGKILSLGGKPIEKGIRLGVRVRGKRAAAPKRAEAFGGSHMPNSSSNIEIVVERRRFGRIATLCDTGEVLEEKRIGKCTGIVSIWDNKR